MHCDGNIQNSEGNTPLHLACYQKSFDAVIQFLRYNCNITLENAYGESAQTIPLNENGDRLTCIHLACQ